MSLFFLSLLIILPKIAEVLISLSDLINTKQSILDKLGVFGKALDIVGDISEGVSGVSYFSTVRNITD